MRSFKLKLKQTASTESKTHKMKADLRVRKMFQPDDRREGLSPSLLLPPIL
jgi:hypothetical protein